MTIEEAIRIMALEREDWETSHCTPYERKCAFDMAINALEKEAWKEEHPVSPLLQKLATNLQPCKQDADDTISRAAAIEAIDVKNVNRGIISALQSIIEELQSAQPDLSGYSDKLRKAAYERGKAEAQDEIIRCGQCKYAEVANKEDAQDGYTCQFHRGSIWFSGSYCSWAERRTDESY